MPLSHRAGPAPPALLSPSTRRVRLQIPHPPADIPMPPHDSTDGSAAGAAATAAPRPPSPHHIDLHSCSLFLSDAPPSRLPSLSHLRTLLLPRMEDDDMAAVPRTSPLWLQPLLATLTTRTTAQRLGWNDCWCLSWTAASCPACRCSCGSSRCSWTCCQRPSGRLLPLPQLVAPPAPARVAATRGAGAGRTVGLPLARHPPLVRRRPLTAAAHSEPPAQPQQCIPPTSSSERRQSHDRRATVVPRAATSPDAHLVAVHLLSCCCSRPSGSSPSAVASLERGHPCRRIHAGGAAGRRASLGGASPAQLAAAVRRAAVCECAVSRAAELRDDSETQQQPLHFSPHSDD